MLTALWDLKDIQNLRQNRSKNILIRKNAVTPVHGSCSLRVMGSRQRKKKLQEKKNVPKNVHKKQNPKKKFIHEGNLTLLYIKPILPNWLCHTLSSEYLDPSVGNPPPPSTLSLWSVPWLILSIAS